MLDLIPSIIPYAFVFLVAYGALSDLSSFRIPNWATYSLFLLFFLHSAASGLKPDVLPHLTPVTGTLSPSSFAMPSIGANLAIAATVFVASLIFWGRGYIGGGDAKYLTATSIWMGPEGILPFLILLCALTLILALFLKLSASWGFLVNAGGLPAFIKRVYAEFEKRQLPYGFPIGLSALLMIPQIFKI